MTACGCGDTKSRAKVLMGDGNTVFVMGTVDAEGKPCIRWMGAFCRDTDNEWALYIASFSKARKMAHIAANPNVQLVFSKPDYSEVVTLVGTAEAVECIETKKLVWSAIPACAQYFSAPEGEDFGVIKFNTKCIELLAMNEQHEPYCVDV